MRSITLLCLACTTLSACAAEAARDNAPPAAEAVAHAQAPPCEGADTFFAGTAIAGDYTQALRVLGERPLCTGPGAPGEIYRLTWMPTFEPPVVVRVERLPDGYRLHGKLGSRAAGYETGPVRRDTVVTLGEADAREFARRLGASRFWMLPTLDPKAPIGTDGARWVLEGLVGARYHAVDRWTPPIGPYRALAEWLLYQSGLIAHGVVAEY